MTSLRLAITADLHFGHNAAGDQATAQLRELLQAQPPDLLLLGGDIGTRDNFDACLDLFADLPCQKALVPGNHDLWVELGDDRGDSLQVYREHLPGVCREYDVHYLDQGLLVLPEADLAVVGCINWYDYSWSLELLQQHVPDWEERLREKRFTRGRHNDARFIRWPLDDVRFTQEVVSRFRDHLHEALAQAARVIVIAHHPPLEGLGFPGRPTLNPDSLLWDALSGNRTIEQLLLAQADRIALVFCGHTHRAREANWGSMRGYNIGGDYRWKRLLLVNWPEGTVQAHSFGELTRPP